MNQTKYNRIIPDSLYTSIQAFQNTTRTIGTEKYKFTDLAVLSSIYANPAITSAGICREMNYTKGYVSQIVSRLEHSGLVYRLHQEGGKNSYSLFVTKKGDVIASEYLETINRESACLMELLRASYTDADIDLFRQIGDHIGQFYKNMLAEMNSR